MKTLSSLPSLALVVACSSAPPALAAPAAPAPAPGLTDARLVGSWTGYGGNYVFRADHHFLWTKTTSPHQMDCPSGCIDIPGSELVLSGTWRLDHGTLTVTYTKIEKMSGPASATVPATLVAHVDHYDQLTVDMEGYLRLVLTIDGMSGRQQLWQSLEDCRSKASPRC